MDERRIVVIVGVTTVTIQSVLTSPTLLRVNNVTVNAKELVTIWAWLTGYL